MIIKKFNRGKKRDAKQGRGWCVCDRVYIEHGKKCPNCGRVNDIKRNKKPMKPFDLED
jgi:hypothetical protein